VQGRYVCSPTCDCRIALGRAAQFHRIYSMRSSFAGLCSRFNAGADCIIVLQSLREPLGCCNRAYSASFWHAHLKFAHGERDLPAGNARTASNAIRDKEPSLWKQKRAQLMAAPSLPPAYSSCTTGPALYKNGEAGVLSQGPAVEKTRTGQAAHRESDVHAATARIWRDPGGSKASYSQGTPAF